jgi:hypothetical protein
MASAVPMSRSRGSVSGFALVLLGAWGGLALFIGPYFHAGFEPDKVWFFSTARLYASILPGAVVLLAGLIVLATRTRWFGGFAAVVAALGGAWFVVGRAVLPVAANNPTAYSVGQEIGSSMGRVLLTDLAAYSGVGLLIVFFAALALGRQSIAAHRDHLRYGETVYQAGTDPGAGLASVGLGSAGPSYTPFQPTEVAASPYPTGPVETYVGGDTQFPSQYPTATETYGGAERYPTAQASYPGDTTDPFDAFTPGPVTYSPGQTQYPPVESTTSMTVPKEEQ